jgi:hypothetical protein
VTGPLVALDWSISPDDAAQAGTLVDDCDDTPHGVLTMRSDPERFWMSTMMGVAALTVLSATYALSRNLLGDRRVLVAVLSLTAGIPAAWLVCTRAVAGDDAFVAGQLDDGGGWVPIGLQLVLSAACAIAIVLPVQYVQRWNQRHPTSTLGAPPWPAPQAGEP